MNNLLPIGNKTFGIIIVAGYMRVAYPEASMTNTLLCLLSRLFCVSIINKI